ncbi:MAG: CHASE3 domain-containing protein [Burkholderiaceae bacterium]|nr:CHASE3 domain-containing protein [Burkholderiaceae bacterium]
MTLERRVLAVFALAIVLLGATGWAAWRSTGESALQARRVQYQQVALTHLTGLLLSLSDAETGERGFIITGDELFLEPYRDARARSGAELQALRALVAEALPADRLDAIEVLVARRHDIQDGIVQARRAQGFAAASQLAASVEGKRLHDQARDEIAVLAAALRAQIEPGELRAARSRQLTRTVVLTGGAIALLLGGLATWRILAELHARQAAEASLRERELVLRQTSARLQRVFDHSLDALCAFDAEGRFVAVSAACESLWGYRPEELLGTPNIDKVLPQDRARSLEIAARVIAGTRTRDFENRYRHRDGRTVNVMWSAQWLPEEQTMFCVARDVTERHDLLAELHHRNQELQAQAAALREATLRAEAADRTKSAFLATMSHELRTPLNSIIGFTGILLMRLAGPLNAEQARQLDMVCGSARHLLALINDVLDISKIEAGRLRVARLPCDLGACIDRALATAQPLAAAKGLALGSEVQAGLREALAHAVGDPRRVEQLLLNLLGNAIKFTDQGSVQLQAWRDGSAPDFVCVAVADTGVGISQADQATLFQPFRQVDAALSRASEGTGLGLAISQGLAGLMGGMISVWSEPGQGSRFTIRLPLRTPEPVSSA